jgi:hypothetical protein
MPGDCGRMTGYSDIMLPLLRRGLYDVGMDFYDLIVRMEQAEISPRPGGWSDRRGERPRCVIPAVAAVREIWPALRAES